MATDSCFIFGLQRGILITKYHSEVRGLSMSELIEAVRSGNIAKVNKALTTCANVNVADERGDTALSLAVKASRPAIIKVLLAADGIDANLADCDGDSPLILAVKACRPEIIKALLAVPGIDVNCTDMFDNTALILAAKGGHAEAVVALLAAPGIKVNHANHSSITALILAAKGATQRLFRPCWLQIVLM
jgi:uncharacterized protein